MKETRKLNEDDIYKDAPGFDPNLEWVEEEYWMKIIKNERFRNTFEELVVVNRGGAVRNLLITDDNPEFLEDALSKCEKHRLFIRV